MHSFSALESIHEKLNEEYLSQEDDDEFEEEEIRVRNDYNKVNEKEIQRVSDKICVNHLDINTCDFENDPLMYSGLNGESIFTK